jgi:hypothetical protein
LLFVVGQDVVAGVKGLPKLGKHRSAQEHPWIWQLLAVQTIEDELAAVPRLNNLTCGIDHGDIAVNKMAVSRVERVAYRS